MAPERPTIEKPEGDIPFELGIEDLVVGDGEEATSGSKVEVHYVGVAFSYLFVFPLVFRFFVATTPQNVMLMADISNYLKFALTLFLAFGVAFETPVAVVLLVLTNLLSLEKLRKARGYVLIIVFVIAAILTPPDVMSQTAMAVPMYLLYEGGLLFATILHKQKQADMPDKPADA